MPKKKKPPSKAMIKTVLDWFNTVQTGEQFPGRVPDSRSPTGLGASARVRKSNARRTRRRGK